MHTAHVLSAHEALQVKSSTIEDIKAQKNWLERFVFTVICVFRNGLIVESQRKDQPHESTPPSQRRSSEGTCASVSIRITSLIHSFEIQADALEARMQNE